MAPTATTRVHQETACPPPLFLVFELGVHPWKLGCTTGAAPTRTERAGSRYRSSANGDCQS